MQTTIQEALAELKTIASRIQKKKELVQRYLVRQEQFKDPHEKDGGSIALIAREIQAIHDLEERIIAIRSAIQKKNLEITVTVKATTRTIHDWLQWRRNILPGTQQFLQLLWNQIQSVRQDAMKKGIATVQDPSQAKTNEVIVNVNEAELGKKIEDLAEVVGTLDGQLSLKNATTVVEI